MRLPPRARVLLLVLAAASLVGGCGSKISEANYFRVKHGMSEEEVEELLGPAHEESSEPLPPDSLPRPRPSLVTGPGSARPAPGDSASTRPALRKVKTWSRDGMTIRVTFEHGFVTARSSLGIPADPPATRAISPEESPPPEGSGAMN